MNFALQGPQTGCSWCLCSTNGNSPCQKNYHAQRTVWTSKDLWSANDHKALKKNHAQGAQRQTGDLETAQTASLQYIERAQTLIDQHDTEIKRSTARAWRAWCSKPSKHIGGRRPSKQALC
jgi:hypothetical protein